MKLCQKNKRRDAFHVEIGQKCKYEALGVEKPQF